jgi:hypothetical protein
MNVRFSSLLAFVGIFLFTSCNKEFSDVDASLLPTDTFVIEKQTALVGVQHERIEVIRTDDLSFLYLGQYQDPVFGTTTASVTTQLSLPLSSSGIFGLMSAENEEEGTSTDDTNINPHNEEETVKNVWLELPFYTNQRDSDGDGVIDIFDIDPDDKESDSDGDGLTDIQESMTVNFDPLKADTDGDGINDGEDTDTINPDADANNYEIEFLFGDSSQEVHFQVKELSYFLPLLDPDDNFQSIRSFYSNNDLEQEGFTSNVLYDDKINLSFEELVFYNEDDSETEDVDESTLVGERLAPRVRIPLEPSYFQQKLFEREGESVLFDNNDFQEYFNGLVISIQNNTNPLLMQLNFVAGQIKIEYDFKKLVLIEDGDTANPSDYVVEDSSSTYTLGLSGVQFNSIAQDEPALEVQNALRGQDDGQYIYLKGGLGVVSYIDLFAGAEGQSQLTELQSNPWLINEANLTFYVDQQKVADLGLSELPSRLYLFDADESTPLEDYIIDGTSGSHPDQVKTTFGGLAQYNEAGEVISYKFVITEHLSKLIRLPDNYENIQLGLCVSSDYLNIQSTEVVQPELEVPQSAISSPLGVILAGPNHTNPDLRLHLEIFYTAYQ